MEPTRKEGPMKKLCKALVDEREAARSQPA